MMQYKGFPQTVSLATAPALPADIRHQELEITEILDRSALLGLSVALGVGLLIGAEREQRKHTGPNRAASGIRTFCVVALVGAVSVMFGGTLVIAVTALVVGAGALLAYQETREQDPGLTTEFALLLTCLLGGVAMLSPLRRQAPHCRP